MSQSTNPSRGRGDEARQALVNAAISVFGERGFDAASTRAIAVAAEVNPAMISYYFGGKQGLYEAAVEHIADQVSTHLAPVAERVRHDRAALAGAPGAAGRAALFELLWSLTDGLLTLLTSERASPWARIILREQQQPSGAFQILYGRQVLPVLELVTELIAALDRHRGDASEHRLTALSVLGQVLAFRAARAASLQFMDWDCLGADELASVRRTLRRNLARMLNVTHE